MIFLVFVFPAVYLQYFDLQYKSISFRALSKVFSSPQITCQKTWLFLPLLKTELLNRYTLFFFLTLHSFSSVSSISESILSLYFSFFFSSCPLRGADGKVLSISYFSSCLFFWSLQGTNVLNRVRIFCDRMPIWDHVFWTPTLKMSLQDKQANQTKTQRKQNPKELYVKLQSDLTLKISMTKTASVW